MMKRLEMSHKRFRMRYNHCDNKIAQGVGTNISIGNIVKIHEKHA